MRIRTDNEYGELQSIILGSVKNGSWPINDQFFNKMIDASTFHGTLIKGPLPTDIIHQTEQQLNHLQDILQQRGVTVVRPDTNRPHCAFSARDILLTIGNKIIVCPTPFSSRQHEAKLYEHLQILFGEWVKVPMPNNINSPMFDAANICKFGDKLLFLESNTGNKAGAKLLQNIVGNAYEVIVWEDVYAHAHIDSTIISLDQNTILLNGSRVTESNLPKFLKGYNKIFLDDIEEQVFHKFPYASKWIGMNILSIDPETVIVDPFYKKLVALLKQNHYNVIEAPLTHARTIGGGWHCMTCDLERL